MILHRGCGCRQVEASWPCTGAVDAGWLKSARHHHHFDHSTSTVTTFTITIIIVANNTTNHSSSSGSHHQNPCIRSGIHSQYLV